MGTALVLVLIVGSLVLLAVAALAWGADSREGVGDDHQRRNVGGAL